MDHLTQQGPLSSAKANEYFSKTAEKFCENHKVEEKTIVTTLHNMAEVLFLKARKKVSRGKYEFSVSGLTIDRDTLYPSLDQALKRCLMDEWELCLERKEQTKQQLSDDKLLVKRGVFDSRDKDVWDYSISWKADNSVLLNTPEPPLKPPEPDDKAFGLARTIGHQPLGLTNNVWVQTQSATKLAANTLPLSQVPYFNALLSKIESNVITLDLSLSERELRFLLTHVYCGRFCVPEASNDENAPTKKELIDLLFAGRSLMHTELLLGVWQELKEQRTTETVLEDAHYVLPVLTTKRLDESDRNRTMEYEQVIEYFRKDLHHYFVQHPEVMQFDQAATVQQRVEGYILARTLGLRAKRKEILESLMQASEREENASEVFRVVVKQVIVENSLDDALVAVLMNAGKWVNVAVNDKTLEALHRLSKLGPDSVLVAGRISSGKDKSERASSIQQPEELHLDVMELCSLLRVGALIESPPTLNWAAAYLLECVKIDEHFFPIARTALAVQEVNTSLFERCKAVLSGVQPEDLPINHWSLGQAMENLAVLNELEHHEFIMACSEYIGNLVLNDPDQNYEKLNQLLDHAENVKSYRLSKVLKSLLGKQEYLENLKKDHPDLYTRASLMHTASLSWKRPRTSSLVNSVMLS